MGRRDGDRRFYRHHGHPLTLDPRVTLCEGPGCWRGTGRACEVCHTPLCGLHRFGRERGRVLCLTHFVEAYGLGEGA